MHRWNDDWFEENGSDLYSAINYVEDTLRKFNICAVGKEKYGTYREYTHFWDGTLHGWLYPGHVAIRNKFMYWKLDPYFISPITKYTGLVYIVRWVQMQAYNYAFQQACKKYPNVVVELIRCLDYAHLIKPGVFGNVCGKTIQNRKLV